ncbi:cytochrome c [Candidatus Aeolococcus gillhamiae]|uniref:c-type cytochrome n=1 Tax=Candidatus Aeolococcus gillhamiae TaxID=3127015 RepID=UPI00307699CE
MILSALLIALVGIAAIRDSQDRDYLAIQQRYQSDHNDTGFNIQVQQIFPAFADAKRGDTFRVERCISCHVPDIGTIGPELAAQRLAQDFMKYQPNAQAVAAQNHYTLVHPAYIANGISVPSATKGFAPAMDYTQYGITGTGFAPYSVTGATTNAKQGYAVTPTTVLPGPLPAAVDPKALNPTQTNPSLQKVGIDQVGCIVCHNGSRLSLNQTDAHQNLIANPEYDFTSGAQLYYKYCVTCHGVQGEGGKGPPLSNQDRLGYFNEDYYYRCIEYGFTDFEHIGSIMPNWGSTATDFTYDPTRDKQRPGSRILSENQIQILIQFIRHWENYNTLP